MTGNRDERAERIVDMILDSRYREEPLHERDCPACDLAASIAGTISCCWDPLENWVETPAPDGVPGDTLLDQLTRLVVFDLHRKLPGHQPTRRTAPTDHTEEDLTDD